MTDRRGCDGKWVSRLQCTPLDVTATFMTFVWRFKCWSLSEKKQHQQLKKTTTTKFPGAAAKFETTLQWTDTLSRGKIYSPTKLMEEHFILWREHSQSLWEEKCFLWMQVNHQVNDNKSFFRVMLVYLELPTIFLWELFWIRPLYFVSLCEINTGETSKIILQKKKKVLKIQPDSCEFWLALARGSHVVTPFCFDSTLLAASNVARNPYIVVFSKKVIFYWLLLCLQQCLWKNGKERRWNQEFRICSWTQPIKLDYRTYSHICI